ncbi:hypothetical protein [Geothermobacter ehrlichii]|uniref:hypothetical protein n=1 Tax=Geothermobacter ehrlichii TaxID=213224 RepID=UPI0011E7871F|nr:hypothetical protein [Geothermobacter ehrlichii]
MLIPEPLAGKIHLDEDFGVELHQTVYALDATTIDLLPEAGVIYVMARGYLDFFRLYRLTKACTFFIIRAKSNLACRRLYSGPVNRDAGVDLRPDDQTDRPLLGAVFPGKAATRKGARLRERQGHCFADQQLYAADSNSCPTLPQPLTDRTALQMDQAEPADKAFYGTSENAVKTQIWIAVIVYLLVAIMKKRLKIGASLYTILQVLRASSFVITR